MEDEGNNPLPEPRPGSEVMREAILKRLEGARAFRDQENPEWTEIMRRQMNNTTEATKAARSEIFANPEQLDMINEKIDQIRDRLEAIDNRYPDDPNSFRHQENDFEATMDLDMPPGQPNTRLALTYLDRPNHVTTFVEFGEKNFHLTLEFTNPDVVGGGLAYNSSDIFSSLPLENMTNEECRIITSTLDLYHDLLTNPDDEN